MGRTGQPGRTGRLGTGRGIFPTIVTDSTENTKNAITRIKEAASRQDKNMAKILGVHLEGIFLNPEKKGIHNPKHFKTLSAEVALIVFSAVKSASCHRGISKPFSESLEKEEWL